MTYTIITNQSEWNIMLGVTGKKMIYVISDQCDGRRNGSDDWATNYEGTNVDYLYLVTFEELSRTLYAILSPLGIGELPAILYYNNSTLEWGRGAMTPDMENHPIEEMDYKNGDDVIAYDTDNDQLVVLSGKSVNHITMPSRYITNGDVLLGVNDGHVHAMSPDFTTAYGVNNNRSCGNVYYRIEIPSSNGNAINAGSFDYQYKATSAGTSGTVTWAAGDTLASIRSQITTASNMGTAVTYDEQAIGLYFRSTYANTMTLTNMQGCSFIDCTKLTIFDESRTVRSGDDYDPSKPVIDNNFKSFTSMLPSDILNTYLNSIGKSALKTTASNLYGENGQNYATMTITNLQIAYAYFKTSGSSSFVSDGVNGSTRNINIMNESTFNNNVNSSADPTTNAGKMYTYYSALQDGTGSHKELHDKLLNKFGSSLSDNNTLYMWYLAAHSTKTNVNSGIISYLRNTGVYWTHILGRVFTVTYNYTYYPAYPQDYNILRYEEQTPIYQYIKDNVNSSQYEVDGDIEIYGMCEPWDLVYMYNDLIFLEINNRQSDSWLGLSNHTNLSYINQIGTISQYSNTIIKIILSNSCIGNYYRYDTLSSGSRPIIVFEQEQS